METNCSVCDGSGTRTYEANPSDFGDSFRGRFLDRVGSILSRLVRIETTCSECGGDGVITESRPKRLDELSTLQRTFLLRADLERETPDEETQQQIEEAKRQAESGSQNVPSQPGQTPSAPTGPSPGGAPPGPTLPE